MDQRGDVSNFGGPNPVGECAVSDSEGAVRSTLAIGAGL